MDETELYHHGVKGMKWGVIRTASQLGRNIVTYKKRELEKNYDRGRKTTSKHGSRGTMLNSYVNYKRKRIVKDTLAGILNCKAYNYIHNEKNNRYISKGMQIARDLGMRSYYLDRDIDRLNALAEVGKSYIYSKKR